MFRIHLARLFLLGAALFAVGCASDRPGLFSSCSSCGNNQPGLWSRLRASSTTQPVVMSGDCCNGQIVSGPYVPPMQPPSTMVLPAPPPQQNSIPRIDDNAKQMPYDPKMSRPGTTTSNDGTTKSGN